MSKDAPAGDARVPGMSAFFQSHSRAWRDFQYVYPVISRRSDGLSIGINLSLDRICNFNCVYCQVDRKTPRPSPALDLSELKSELERMLDMVLAPDFWTQGPLAGVAPGYRRLDNLAFSGDGEPTICRWFLQTVALAAAAKVQRGLKDVKLVLITNASQLCAPDLEPALRLLHRYDGEIWAKLDAGNEQTFGAINRARVPLADIVENLVEAGKKWPLVIQSMVLRIKGEPVSQAAFEDYLTCLEQLRARGCQVRRVQLYTVARQPAEPGVEPVSDLDLDHLAERFRQRLPDLPVRAFYAS